MTFAQRWSPQTGQSFGRLLAGSIVIAFGWWSAVLLVQLALSPLPTTLGELDAALLAVPPLTGCIMAALLLETLPQPWRVFGAAGALTVAALLPSASIALTTGPGVIWPRTLLAGGLVFVCLLPALALISPARPSPWRNIGALLLCAIGILLPQILRLAWWPAGDNAAGLDGTEWLSRVITLDTGATIALFLLIRRLLGYDSQARRAARSGDELDERLQAIRAEKESLERLHARHCEHLLQSANVGLFEWAVKSGDLKLSGAWASMLGYEEEQAAQLSQAPDPWRQLCHPREVALAERLLR
ncbi:MAG TPA: hypothetical protein VK305_15885, partial [Roseateles sp.]|nr:hypothetical protein [Roseateles sp.]